MDSGCLKKKEKKQSTSYMQMENECKESHDAFVVKQFQILFSHVRLLLWHHITLSPLEGHLGGHVGGHCSLEIDCLLHFN